ncbi:MAG: KPN_02809 family neutral zinc metallopeptidase [Thermoleophilia bacterium]
MQWKGRRRSANVEDRRGMSRKGGGLAVGGGLGTVVIVVLYLLLGGDPSQIAGQVGAPSGAPSQTGGTVGAQSDELAQFVAVVLADTEEVWAEVFRETGRTYRDPGLVLFTGAVESACGTQSSAVGPFYCPADQTVYIDLSFYDELKERHGAPGDFAQAYVIAHEVGHHVQKLLGVSDQVNDQRDRVSETEYNQLLVRMELQADFLAGVWAHHAQQNWQVLEAGDVEEALAAASAIGDDRLQRESTGRVVPDSFTHGTSEQRVRWFQKGLDTGDISQGDTFSAERL